MTDTGGLGSLWGALRTRQKHGEPITNEELATLVALATTEPIPADMRALIADRLRHGPPKKRRGRPSSDPNARVRAHLFRALVLESMLHFEWARLGGGRGQKERAAEQVARDAQLSVETLRRILSHDAPKARRAVEQDPTLWWPLSEVALQTLAEAREGNKKGTGK